jgi:hypothetical protein
MALALYDRVQETTTTTGTGTITLAGAVAGFQSFAVVGNGNTTYYCITSGTAWEVGLGTYSTSGPTLARTTVYSNSLGTTAKISLTGTSNVFLTLPAEQFPGTSYSRTSFTASASQTSFTVNYTVGYVQVYVNGVLLNASDYTASTGTSVVLAVACNSGDIVEVIAFNATNLTGTSRTVTDFTATASQTTFTITYTPGFIDVYRNGVKLATADYTATNGTSVVLASGCTAGDVVQTVAYSPVITSSSAGGSNTQVQYNSAGGLTGSPNLTFDGTYLSSNTGLVPGELIYRLNTAYVGTATTSAQSFLGVGVTVSGSTVYQFEAVLPISKTASATSHNLQIGFGGTATINNISYEQLNTASSATSFNDTSNGAWYGGLIQTASATTIASPGATAAIYKNIILKGTVSINAGGTFIPQYTTSVSVGPYTTAIGSYFKLSPMSASGANTSIGTWA